MPLEIKGGVIAPASMTCDICPLVTKCLFDQKRLGGFKRPGERAHYIGYRLITDKTERNAVSVGAKEDFCTCFNFVEVLQDRMLAGQALRAEGKDGEIVAVIAQEGGMIRQRHRVGYNARGEVIRPQLEIIEALKAVKGLKLNLDDNSLAVGFKSVVVEVPVPRYDEVLATVGDYGQEIMARAMAEQEMRQETDELAWQEVQKRMATEDQVMAKAEPVAVAKADPMKKSA